MSARTIIDLTHPIDNNMGLSDFRYNGTFIGTYRSHEQAVRKGEAGEEVSATSNVIILSDHTGTHLDAPFHFDPNGKPIDQTTLDAVYGPGVVLDFCHKDGEGIIDLLEVEEKFGQFNLQHGAVKIVLLRTGAAQYYGTPEYRKNPLLKKEMVSWLLDRGVTVVGVDARAVDWFPSREAHMLMRQHEFYIIEDLTNLDKVPEGRIVTLSCLPIPFVGASASPIRAVAILEE